MNTVRCRYCKAAYFVDAPAANASGHLCEQTPPGLPLDDLWLESLTDNTLPWPTTPDKPAP